MAEEAGKAWLRAARELTARLPGDWVVARPGARAVLVRKPVDWRLVWVGLDRVRGTTTPSLIAGAVPLVRRFSMSYACGLRSTDRPWEGPAKVDLLSPELPDLVERFVIEAGLPVVDGWTEQRMAETAERDLAEVGERRGVPRWFLDVAGWRVVNDAGSPEEPARLSLDECRRIDDPEGARWFEAFLDAWAAGGRSGALGFLEEQRAAVLTGLKVP